MAALSAPILIDGSYGEGGGALLRTSVVLAALTQQPLRISNIRGATKHPGLSQEDMTVIKLIAKSCSAETVGFNLGSSELSFLPTRHPRPLQKIQADDFDAPNGESQCPAIILGSILPLLARSGGYSTLTLNGETYGNGILSFDSFQLVTLGALKRFGLHGFTEQIEAGFGRGSKGKIELEVEPSALNGVDWSNRGNLVQLNAVVATSELPSAVAKRGISHLENLAKNGNLRLSTHSVTPQSREVGAHVTVWAEFENGFGSASAMGKKGVRIESIAQAAFDQCLQFIESNTAVDPFLADQIVVAAALAEGDTTFSVQSLTMRLITTVWVIKQLLPIRLTIKGHEGQPGVITVRR